MRFLCELKHKVRLSKGVCGVFHCWFYFVSVKIYFFAQQKMHSLIQNVISLFKILIKENPAGFYSQTSFFLSCYKKFQNSVISARAGAPQKLTRRPIFKTSKSEVFKWKSEEIFDSLLLINLFIFLVGLRNIF